MMANSRKRPVILGGSILCCGDLGASSPETFSNQLLKPPLPFCLSFRLTAENSSYILSVPVFRSGKGQTVYVDKSMVFWISAQQAKLPGELAEQF
jgi:hypothetical protein